MQKYLVAIAALSVAAGMSTAVRAANIVYSINQSSTTPEVGGELTPLSDTVVGTITTDGTLGSLTPSHIVDYNLELKDNLRSTYDFDLTPSDSGIWSELDYGLTATLTGLSFNFSDSGAVFVIQGIPPLGHGISSGFNYFCFQASSGPCVKGETIVPDYYSVDGVQATGLVGTVHLSGAPEPATWAMMLLGLGGLGAVVRLRRQTVAVPA